MTLYLLTSIQAPDLENGDAYDCVEFVVRDSVLFPSKDLAMQRIEEEAADIREMVGGGPVRKIGVEESYEEYELDERSYWFLKPFDVEVRI